MSTVNVLILVAFVVVALLIRREIRLGDALDKQLQEEQKNEEPKDPLP